MSPPPTKNNELFLRDAVHIQLATNNVIFTLFMGGWGSRHVMCGSFVILHYTFKFWILTGFSSQPSLSRHQKSANHTARDIKGPGLVYQQKRTAKRNETASKRKRLGHNVYWSPILTLAVVLIRSRRKKKRKLKGVRVKMRAMSVYRKS